MSVLKTNILKSTVKKQKNFLKVITTSIQSLPAKVAASLLAITAFAGACSDPSEIILDPDNNQIGVFYQEIPLSASMVLLDSLVRLDRAIWWLEVMSVAFLAPLRPLPIAVYPLIPEAKRQRKRRFLTLQSSI